MPSASPLLSQITLVSKYIIQRLLWFNKSSFPLTGKQVFSLLAWNREIKEAAVFPNQAASPL